MLTQRQRLALRNATNALAQHVVDVRAEAHRVGTSGDTELARRRLIWIEQSVDVLQSLWDDEESLVDGLEWAVAHRKVFPCDHDVSINAGEVGRSTSIEKWICPNCGLVWCLNGLTGEVLMGYMWGPDVSHELEEDGA